MKIDKAVERRVREAYARSVTEEPDKFDSAMTNLAHDDESLGRALALAFAIDTGALLSIHHGQRPDDAQLQHLAGNFAETQAWSGIDKSAALTFLTAIADVRLPTEAMPVADATYAALAIGGWLLSSFLPDDGSHWNNFLDLILDQLEKASD
jgi:hypothetical protein